MFKRRRGIVFKCAALIAAFWLGFFVYVMSIRRPDDDDLAQLSASRTRSDNRQRRVTGQQPTLEPPEWLPGRDNEKARRDRGLQDRFRRDQSKLQEALSGRKTPRPARGLDLRKYDPQTASLIRSGLIVPKWNISEEMPEHNGAPGFLSTLYSFIDQLRVLRDGYNSCR